VITRPNACMNSTPSAWIVLAGTIGGIAKQGRVEFAIVASGATPSTACERLSFVLRDHKRLALALLGQREEAEGKRDLVEDDLVVEDEEPAAGNAWQRAVHRRHGGQRDADEEQPAVEGEKQDCRPARYQRDLPSPPEFPRGCQCVGSEDRR